jgi:capsule polysaccharide export protein KpsE/RkpR
MNGTEKDLRDGFLGQTVLRAVRNLRRIIALCLVVALATAAYVMLVEKRWEATAVAMVPGTGTTGLPILSGLLGAGTGNSGLGGLASQLVGMSGTSAETDLMVVQQVLTSRTVMERLILEYDLVRRYRTISMEKTLTKLNSRVSVSLTPEGFFVVAAQGSSREEAAAMAMDLIDYANDELSRLVTSRARRGRIEAEKALEEAADSLESAQARMEVFREGSGLNFPEEQGAAAVTVFESIETELVLAEADLAGYAGGVSSRNEAYLQVARRISYLKEALQSRLTTGDSLSVFPGMALFPGYIREYDRLYMELETRRAVYLLVRQELETLRLDEVKESPTLEVVVPPAPEHLRAYPRRARTVILYTGLAFMLALLWMGVITYVDRLMADGTRGPFWRDVLGGIRSQLLPGCRRRQL